MWSAFEFFCGGFELGNAFSELNDPVEQHKRFASSLMSASAATTRRHQMDEDYGGRWRMGCLQPAARHRHPTGW